MTFLSCMYIAKLSIPQLACRVRLYARKKCVIRYIEYETLDKEAAIRICISTLGSIRSYIFARYASFGRTPSV